jgi:hypothetical protein
MEQLQMASSSGGYEAKGRIIFQRQLNLFALGF